MAVTYLRLFPATTQFVMKNGMLNVAGLLHIYLEGTDDVAPVFDTDGSQLQQPVMLDNDGRARGLFVDASKVYWMKVCDRDDGQIYTVRKMVPSGGGAGSALGKSYSVISSDGTVDVTEFDSNGTTVFDLSCDIENEVSKWGSSVGLRSVIDGDDTWAEVQVISTTGSVTYNNGWGTTKDCLGDIAASIEMSGHDGSAISTIDTKMVVTVDGTEIFSETGLLDPTENAGRCSFEWKGELSEGQKVDARIYVKCVQGINLGLVGRVFYNEECDGVVGGEGTTYVPGTGIDIAGDVISVTGMATQSAFDACCSSVENAISSLSSTVSGLTGQYVEISAISAESSVWNSASAISSITADVTSLSSDLSSLSSTVSGLTGQYVEQSSISAQSSVWNSASAISAITADVSALQDDVSSLSSDITSMSGNMSSYVNYNDIAGTTASAITSINGSAIGSTGDYVEKSAMEVTIGSGNSAGHPVAFAQGVDNAAEFYSFAQGGNNTAEGLSASLAQGTVNYAGHASLAQGNDNSAYASSLAQGASNTALFGSYAQGGANYAFWHSIAQGYGNSAEYAGLAQGSSNTAWEGAGAIGSGNTADRYSLALGRENTAHDGSLALGKRNMATGDSLAQGSDNSAEYHSVAIGDNNSASNYSVVFGKNNKLGNGHTGTGDGVAFTIGDGDTDSARHDLLNVFKNGRIVTYSSTSDTAGFDLISAISSVSASAGLPLSGTTGVYSANYTVQSARWADDYDAVSVDPDKIRLWHNGFSADVDYSSVNRWNSAADEMSAKLDKTAIECDTASAITAIGGSSIGGGGGVVTSTGSGEYVYGGTSGTGISGINGSGLIAVAANSADSANYALSADTFTWGARAVSGTQSVRLGGNNSSVDHVSGGTGAGIFLNGTFGTSYYKVNELVQNRDGTGQIKFNIGGGGSQITVSSDAGGKFSACGPSKATSYYSAFNASASAGIGVGSGIASARLAGGQAYIILHDSAASATAYASSINSWNAKLDSSAIECTTASAITAIGGSSIGGGGLVTSTASGTYMHSGGTETAVSAINESGILASYANTANIAYTAGVAEEDTSGRSIAGMFDSLETLYSAFTAVSSMLNTYSSYFSSISAKVDSTAIGVE